LLILFFLFFFSSRRRHTRSKRDWSSDVCSSDLSYGNRLATPLCMKERSLTIPEISLIAGTRVALGTGIGLLISGRLNKDHRKARSEERRVGKECRSQWWR